MNKTVTLTEPEAKLVMQSLDVAVRQGGLQAAAALLDLARNIELQLTQPNPTQHQNPSQ
jgi:hypothetical protein